MCENRECAFRAQTSLSHRKMAAYDPEADLVIGLVAMAYRLWQTGSAEGASAVRIIITCTIVTLLAGCETKPPAPPATSGEREQAVIALNACLQTAARKLDDAK